jgi:hypothetical protein
MLGDTLTLPLSSGNVVVTKINQDGYSSEYVKFSATSEYRVRVRHTKTGKSPTRASYDRHSFDVTHTTYADGETPESHIKFYFVIECLPGNDSIVLADGVCDLAIASSGAVLTKLLGWES